MFINFSNFHISIKINDLKAEPAELPPPKFFIIIKYKIKN